MKKTKKTSSRKFKLNSISVAMTCVVILIVILFNAFTLLLVNKMPQLNIDMTTKNLYDFTDETKTLLDSLEDETEILVFATESELSTDIKDQVIVQMLKKMTALSDKLSVQFLDKYKNQGRAVEFNLYSSNSNEVYIVVHNKNNNHYRVLTKENMLAENGQYYDVEYAIDTAIMINSKNKLSRVAFINGHGEEIPYAFVQMMEDAAYETGSISFGELDASVDYVVLYAPSTDITIDEAHILSSFLFNDGNYGKNALVFYGEKTPKMPNLEKVLEDYGIKVNNEIVLDSSNGVAGDPTTIFTTPVHEKIGFSVNERKIAIPVHFARSLTQLFEEKDITNTQAILASTPTSYVKPNDANLGQNLSKGANDKEGSYLIAAKGEKIKFKGEEPIKSSIFVSGAASLADKAYLAGGSYGNHTLLSDVLKSTQSDYASIDIVPKKANTETLNITKNNFIAICVFVFGIIPIMILIPGIIIFIKRRNK